MIGAVIFISFIVLLLISMPVGYAIGISAVLGVLVSGMPVSVIPSYCLTGTDSFTLLALPLFVLSGNLMSTGSIARRLLDLCDCLLGWLTGGLAMVCTVTCMFFAAISGSAVATTCAVGTFLIPRMTNRGYDKGFAGAITASAGSIGVIIPPSIPFVLYGCVAKVSIGDLFVAGFLPGIMMGAALMITSYFYCKKNGWKGEPGKYTVEDTWNCFKDAFWAILMPVIILGGIYSGIFTPTECAGVACVYCLVVSCFVYRDLDLKGVRGESHAQTGTGRKAIALQRPADSAAVSITAGKSRGHGHSDAVMHPGEERMNQEEPHQDRDAKLKIFPHIRGENAAARRPDLFEKTFRFFLMAKHDRGKEQDDQHGWPIACLGGKLDHTEKFRPQQQTKNAGDHRGGDEEVLEQTDLHTEQLTNEQKDRRIEKIH